ncbi:MAG: hypothetical protein WC314_05880 [Vulcanimicrobiota bacterium]
MKTSSLSRKAIVELSQVQSDACISLLMSTASSGARSRQGAARFKNLLTKAEVALSRKQVREDEIETLLKPAKLLLGDTPFWSHRTEGLAVYLESGAMRLFQLAFPVQDRVVVGERFHVRPLLKAAVQEDFYILSLNLKGVQLLQCGEHGVREFAPEGFPESLPEAMSMNTSDHQPNGSRPEVHHRQYMGMEENRKAAMEQWLRSLARAVESFLGPQGPPLILAGVQYVVAEYRKQDRYPHTLSEAAIGSTERKSHQDLLEVARPILEGCSEKRLQELLERYQSGLNQGRSIAGLQACLRAATAGTVDHLLVAEGATSWGSFCADSLKVSPLDQEQPEAEELFERACLDTLKNGGDVSLLSPLSFPNGDQITAILRFYGIPD